MLEDLQIINSENLTNAPWYWLTRWGRWGYAPSQRESQWSAGSRAGRPISAGSGWWWWSARGPSHPRAVSPPAGALAEPSPPPSCDCRGGVQSPTWALSPATEQLIFLLPSLSVSSRHECPCKSERLALWEGQSQCWCCHHSSCSCRSVLTALLGQRGTKQRTGTDQDRPDTPLTFKLCPALESSSSPTTLLYAVHCTL